MAIITVNYELHQTVSEAPMRSVIVALLLSQLLFGQSPVPAPDNKCACAPDPRLLYQRVVRAMWEKDEGEHPYASANGFIRIGVHPAWHNEYFFDVRLNNSGRPTITVYTLPKETKTVTLLIESALKNTPCTSAEAISAAIPIRRRSIAVTNDVQRLLDEFFTIRIAPKRIPNAIRFDATEYEVEFQGDDFFRFNSDNYDAPIAKWVRSFEAAVKAADTGS